MKLFTIIFVISVVGFTATQDTPLSQEINGQMQMMPMMMPIDSLFPNLVMDYGDSFDGLAYSCLQYEDAGIEALIQSKNSYKDYYTQIQAWIDDGKTAVKKALDAYVASVMASSLQIDAAYSSAAIVLTQRGCVDYVPVFRNKIKMRMTDFSMSFGTVMGCIPDQMLGGVYTALQDALTTQVDGISRFDGYKLAENSSLAQVSCFYQNAANYTATYLLQVLDGSSVDKVIADIASQAQDATCP